MRFDIKPHVGANHIEFGMTKENVRKILGAPAYSSEKSVFKFEEISIPTPATDGYFENELQISYDDNNQVEFIEFSGRGSQFTTVYLDNIEVFKTPAKQLINTIEQLRLAEYDKTDEEIPFSYVFRNIDLAVWRQVVPDLDEDKEEIPEIEEGKYFWTIGIGSKGYYTKED
jgi:hypothetical protein